MSTSVFRRVKMELARTNGASLKSCTSTNPVGSSSPLDISKPRMPCDRRGICERPRSNRAVTCGVRPPQLGLVTLRAVSRSLMRARISGDSAMFVVDANAASGQGRRRDNHVVPHALLRGVVIIPWRRLHAFGGTCTVPGHAWR